MTSTRWAEGALAGEILMALRAGARLGSLRRGAAGKIPFNNGFGVIVGLLKALNGLADALSQLRQAPGAEKQQGDDQDDNEGGEIVTEH